jgi:hypothetical protein
MKPPAGEPQMRDDGGADQPTRFDGDLQSTVPPQPEANVVGEVFVAVAPVQHAIGLAQERKENNRK